MSTAPIDAWSVFAQDRLVRWLHWIQSLLVWHCAYMIWFAIYIDMFEVGGRGGDCGFHGDIPRWHYQETNIIPPQKNKDKRNSKMKIKKKVPQ